MDSEASDAAISIPTAQTAEVYVAAPSFPGKTLHVTGATSDMGNWKNAKGQFSQVAWFETDFCIYRGEIPIPPNPGSAFKFIVVSNNGKLDYEGCGKEDNRNDELEPGSIHFFIYKTKPRFWEKFKDLVSDKKVQIHRNSIVWFMSQAFRQAAQGAAGNLLTNVEYLLNFLKKIRSMSSSSECYECWAIAANSLLAEKQEMEHFFLLLICCSQIGHFPQVLKNFARNNSKELSLYVHQILMDEGLKPQQNTVMSTLKMLASDTEGEFLWIFFRFHRDSPTVNDKDSEKILTTLDTIPEVLLCNENSVRKLIQSLLRCNPFDYVFTRLYSKLKETKNIQFLQDELYNKFSSETMSWKKSTEILLSNFVKEMSDLSLRDPINNGDRFLSFLLHIFSLPRERDIIQLVCSTPDYLKPAVTDVLQEVIDAKTSTKIVEDLNDFQYLAEQVFDSDHLDSFPEIKEHYKQRLIMQAIKIIASGQFKRIPSIKLLLVSLSRYRFRYLTSPSIKDLVGIVSAVPRGFFPSLHQAVGSDLGKEIRSHQETREIVATIQRHVDMVSTILDLIQSQNIAISDMNNLTDGPTVDYLRNVGMTEQDLNMVIENGNHLRRLHNLYSNIATMFQTTGDVQLLNKEEWDRYLEDIHFSSSKLKLKTAMELEPPIPEDLARWLETVGSCPIFLKNVWEPLIEEEQENDDIEEEEEEAAAAAAVVAIASNTKEFARFIKKAADRWKTLALRVCQGLLTLRHMEEAFSSGEDVSTLCCFHLDNGQLPKVAKVCRDFFNLIDLKKMILPFFSALSCFSIINRKAINDLLVFVRDRVINKWELTTMEQIYKSGLIATLNNDLNIVPNRPETKSILKLVSSLSTGEDHSCPLLDWLREKNDQDMEAMGRILQGNLLEAYGMLQTLKTKLSPFLERPFQTYQELLKALAVSEKQFSNKKQNVRTIDTQWLTQMLPEIEAAIRAAVISPQEDAKMKLSQISHVIVSSKEDSYLMEILASPSGSLSLEETRQAFQILEMSVSDDLDEDVNEEKSLRRVRNVVPKILVLSNVLEKLHKVGFMTYNFQRREISMDELDNEIEDMKTQLENWKQLWDSVSDMPFLAYFSRGYLLYIADLVFRNRRDEILSIVPIFYQDTRQQLEQSVGRLIRKFHPVNRRVLWFSIETLSAFFRDFNDLIRDSYSSNINELKMPICVRDLEQTLRSYFVTQAVQIFNVNKEFIVPITIAAHVSFRKAPCDPSRILLARSCTTPEEIIGFLIRWSIGDPKRDLFVISHIERLNAACIQALRDRIVQIVPEKRIPLLLLAQHQHRAHATKSLGARLGLVFDRYLELNSKREEFRQIASVLPFWVNEVLFLTSRYPGCGKSQSILQLASKKDGRTQPRYYRIPIRLGTTEELLTALNGLEKLLAVKRKRPLFLHLDVAYCVSLEFNDVLLSFFIHGVLFDGQKPKLGYWSMSRDIILAIELASPLSEQDFPIIQYFGKQIICDCNKTTFTYELAKMPSKLPGYVRIETSHALVVAAKFLDLKSQGSAGIIKWDEVCQFSECFFLEKMPTNHAYKLLIDAFQTKENRSTPTYSAINGMANFLHKHLNAMISSIWFNHNAILLFEDQALTRIYKRNVFDLLLKVANDTVSRTWSISTQPDNQTEMNWSARQRAILLLGVNELGEISGMNVIGRNQLELEKMFDPILIPILKLQSIQFQQLNGFSKLIQDNEGQQLLISAIRSLLLLDGTKMNFDKVHYLDNQTSESVTDRLKFLFGNTLDYAITGDNLTKMMFALYRIRCGLPVIIFGEAGVGKSALFRFLVETLLGHSFKVCNVNSGTTVEDVFCIVDDGLEEWRTDRSRQIFIFWDEINTADDNVIALLKQLMIDRYYNSEMLPENLHFMAAANPYRTLTETDADASVGLSFRFIGSSEQSVSFRDKLVYRVNPLPISLYEHVYDFGQLCDEAEEIYIEEMCLRVLYGNTKLNEIQKFSELIKKSHKEARKRSNDPLSVVSLRDASRAVTLFHWFRHSEQCKVLCDSISEAGDMAIYLVYAFRFLERRDFLQQVFGTDRQPENTIRKASIKLAEKLQNTVQGFFNGIALNNALCENLFALYVCVLNSIFLIIVGRPGTSKSLSVELLKMVLSSGNHVLRQKLGGLPSVTELYYQCSPLSTSSGFKALFESARKLSQDPKVMLAMVILDELGLADLSPDRPIKVLHSELERGAVLTSGEKQKCPYSVVALSNWVVDAAQVNRGILIRRTNPEENDLLGASIELATSILFQNIPERAEKIKDKLKPILRMIVEIFFQLDDNSEVGGGHFFSLRDFFFCVKNLVFSIVPSTVEPKTFTLNNQLVKSVIRNFGGHDGALESVVDYLSVQLSRGKHTIPTFSPVELILDNIKDSRNRKAVHIARHLMILNRSMVALQLLNHYLRKQLGIERMGWHVIFGSCFPGDLEVVSVTRKLRQVEQAIRSGGILILCYADQLFESLYMVLNQQYWTQGEVTMTQIALGPSSRSIALPEGFFRIIALQDKDNAMNRNVMSPAVLSRFEKRELSCRHLLKETGLGFLQEMESHPVLLHTKNFLLRKRLIHGYHDDLLASLALHMQIVQQARESTDSKPNFSIDSYLTKVFNPMEMLKLEQKNKTDPEIMEYCQRFRKDCVFNDMRDVFNQFNSNRIIITTNTMAHLEIRCDCESETVRLFEIESEMELRNQLDAIIESGKQDRDDFCLFIQHDAVSRPVEQYQLAKYEVESRFQDAKCKIIIVVHINQQSSGMSWNFVFCDGWDHCFVDDFMNSSVHWNRLQLRSLLQVIPDSKLSHYLDSMNENMFRALLFEMLGPILQQKLTCLGSYLGDFLRRVRLAISLPNSSRLTMLLKDCLSTQLHHNDVPWDAAEATADESFDSTASLSEALWHVFLRRLSLPLCHLLIISDVFHVCDDSTLELWCQFIENNYPNRLLCLNHSSAVQIPAGFRISTQPFGRLFLMLDDEYLKIRSTEIGVDPVFRLLQFLKDDKGQYSDQRKEGYFRDWLFLRIPSRLHHCVSKLPFQNLKPLIEDLFEYPDHFIRDWNTYQSAIYGTFEILAIIVSFMEENLQYGRTPIRSWTSFMQTTIQLVLEKLQKVTDRDVFCHSVTSIEVIKNVNKVLTESEGLCNDWMALRITQRLYLFDEQCSILPLSSRDVSPDRLMKSLTNLLTELFIRPKMEGIIRRRNLEPLLKVIASSSDVRDLRDQIYLCPNSKVVFIEQDFSRAENCPSCNEVIGHDLKHFQYADDELVQDLWEKYQRFLFFFERTAELFIEEGNVADRRQFLSSLLQDNTHLQVSWRFMTSIVRNIRNIPDENKIINSILTTKNCNRPWELSNNCINFLRALLRCTENHLTNEEREFSENRKINTMHLVLNERWTVERIMHVAILRQLLINHSDRVAPIVFKQWITWKRNDQNSRLSNDLLFFLLRFSCDEGDETKLNNLFKDETIAQELDRHNIVGPYMRNLSPLALKFPIFPQGKRCSQFDGLVTRNEPVANPKFFVLHEIQPEWAVFIARLAYHVADAAEERNWSLFNEMAKNPSVAVNCYLPGISNHMYLEGFEREPFRWYVCSCRALAYVGNCGGLTPSTVCSNCRRVMGNIHVPLTATHIPHTGIRHATADDFRPPMGFYVEQEPLITPTYSVRNASPLVTRCSTLLNSLALLSGVLENRIPDAEIERILRTCKAIELTNNGHYERLLFQILSNHIIVDLNVFMELSYKSVQHIQMADRFRIFHLFIHRMMQDASPILRNNIQLYRDSVNAREQLETYLQSLLNNQNELLKCLRAIKKEGNEDVKKFQKAMEDSRKGSWVYERKITCGRRSVQLILARNAQLSKENNNPFLSFILDDHWANLLDVLEYLADGLRFVSLARTLLQSKFSRQEAYQLKLADGLQQMIEEVGKNPVLLDRGQLICTENQIMELFTGIQQLWKRFSQIVNAQGKTFLDHFECQEVDVNVQPKKTIDRDTPLIFILAGNEIPESTFIHQLLYYAIDAANSIFSNDFIRRCCKSIKDPFRLSCSSAGDLSDFNPLFYAHFSFAKFDQFLTDHTIDASTLPLAELYAKVSILGSEKRLRALQLDPLQDFMFKEDFIDGHSAPYLEKRWQSWKPTSINSEILERILKELEQNHDLGMARTALLSALHFVGQTVADPLYVSKMRNQFVVDILKELMDKEIITDQHVSNQLLGCLNHHLKLEIRHVFGLLRAIDGRMRADDMFFGRVPKEYQTLLNKRQEELTKRSLRENGDILDTLSLLVNNIHHDDRPKELMPNQSLLDSVRQIEGSDWNGLPPELRMEHLGHVLLIAESLNDK